MDKVNGENVLHPENYFSYVRNEIEREEVARDEIDAIQATYVIGDSDISSEDSLDNHLTYYIGSPLPTRTDRELEELEVLQDGGIPEGFQSDTPVISRLPVQDNGTNNRSGINEVEKPRKIHFLNLGNPLIPISNLGKKISIHPLLNRVSNWSPNVHSLLMHCGGKFIQKKNASLREYLLKTSYEAFLRGAKGFEKGFIVGAIVGGVITATLLLILLGPQGCLGMSFFGLVLLSMVKGGLLVGTLNAFACAFFKRKISSQKQAAIGGLFGATTVTGYTPLALTILFSYVAFYGASYLISYYKENRGVEAKKGAI